MSIRKDVDYPGRWDAATTEYPMGKPKNRTTSTSKDGSYLEKKWIGDYEAFFGALLNAAGVSPNGTVDTAEASQFFDALMTNVMSPFVGLVLPDSLMSASRGFAFLADGAEYNRADYPKLWSKVKGTAMLVSQSLINADPETYAASYGDGDGSTTFTLPNYGLRPHLAVAGVLGDAGSTVEDQIQNITGTIGSLTGTSSSSIIQYVGGSGAFIANKSDRNVLNQGNDYTFTQDAGVSMSFDASRVVRAGGRTEVNSSFLNFYIIHGEIS